MTDILDPNVKSKPVLPSGGAGNKKSLFLKVKLRLHNRCKAFFYDKAEKDL